MREALDTKKQKVSNGDYDTGGRFPYVGNYAPGNRSCSAVLISPTTVVTASHCFLNPDCDWLLEADPQSSVNLSGQNFTLNFNADPNACNNAVGAPGTCPGHTAGVSGTVQLLSSSASCTADLNRVMYDIAVFNLDQRVPFSVIRPVDLTFTAPTPRTCPTDDFKATLVGYGPRALDLISEASTYNGLTTRNFAESDDWDTYLAKNQEHIYRGAHWNSWSGILSAGSFTSWVEYYEGSLPGDSGGALVRTGSGPSSDLLCGVCSGHKPAPGFDLVDIESYYPTVWTEDAQTFLQANLLDFRGNLRGTCSPKLPAPGQTLSPLEDTDSDGDTIPDACDPCPVGVQGRDPQYILNGTFSPQFLIDTDQDGMADVCDPCPTINDPGFLAARKSSAIFVPDADKDGRADVCDPCPQVAGVPMADSDGDGLGDACDVCGNSGVPDLVCCTVGVAGQCNKGAICVPSIAGGTGAASCPPGAPGAGFCSQPRDEDGDGLPNHCDNCPLDSNAYRDATGKFLPQSDTDGDGLGNACDGCPGSRDPRLFPLIASSPALALLDVAGLQTCNPLAGANPPADADAFCQSVTGSVRSRCVFVRQAGAAPTGVCSESGPDNDQDGVWDACDNCVQQYNPDQDNCNIEAEMVANPSGYPFVGDVCDRHPCSYVRGLQDTPVGSPPASNTTGTALLELTPILLPPTVANTPLPPFALTSTSVPPRSRVGNSFCACDNGPFSEPWECIDPLLGNCVINPSLYSTADSASWLKPDLHPNATPNSPPTTPSAPLSELPNLSTSNASQQSFPLLDQGQPSLVNWETAKLGAVATTLPGANSDDTKSCHDGFGVSGLYWTSVREVSTLNATPSQYTTLSSHYEYGQWGSLPDCFLVQGNNPTPILPPKPCLFCDCPACGSWGVPDVRIYINPGDLYEHEVLALDGEHVRVVGKLPVLPGSSLTEGRPITASDFAHTRPSGPDLAVLSGDGTRVLAAVERRKGTLVSLLTTRRAGVAALDAEADPAIAALASGLTPPPRQGAHSTMSKRWQTIFLAGGQADGQPLNDLWRYDLTAQAWSPITLQGDSLGQVLAMTFHGPDEALYVVDERKLGWFKVGRVLRIDPSTGATKVMGVWPRLQAFDRFFLNVGESGELLLAASQDKTKKGGHLVLVFATSATTLLPRWSVRDHGALAAEPSLTRDGLTRPFASPAFAPQRFTPTHDLPKKLTAKPGDCF